MAGLALLASAAAAQPPADLFLDPVTDIGSGRAVAVRSAGDGSNRLFIVQQEGIVWVYDQVAEQLLGTPFLDIQLLVDDGGNEQGLLGIAFDPDYASNGYFYVNYTYDPGPGLDRTRIARYTVSAGDANVANAASATTILEVAQDFSNHNAGDLAFGPDGYLYIPLGDGGDGSDPFERAQDPDQLLGKILRIDPTGVVPPSRSSQRGVVDRCGLIGAYDVPNDNPFVDDDNTCDEIWAFGLRNPFRFSFDRLTGDMLIGDVGQGAREEVNFQPAASMGGENYGWDCREGLIFHENNDFCPPAGPLTDPIIDYAHGGPIFICSVIGGYVYRGGIAGMQGTYWYADVCSGQIWYATEAGGWTPVEWGSANTPYSFGEDDRGELYLSNAAGQVFRFSSELLPLFADGFETGDTTSWSLPGF